MWSKNLSHGDRVLWVLEHKDERFLIEEILPTESTSRTSLETVLVIKHDEQSLWSYWLHKSLGLEESQTFSLGSNSYAPGALQLKAALHLPAEPFVSAAKLVVYMTM